ncbi:hypothetical protein SE17_12995, partial [Kouleothrix aurantiaca]
METRTVSVGSAPRIVIGDCRGDLEITVGENGVVEISSSQMPDRVQQTDEALVIERAARDLELSVPSDAEIVIERIGGDLLARDFAALAVQSVGGDVELNDLSGAAQLGRVGGDLSASHLAALEVSDRLNGELRAESIKQLQVDRIDGDADVDDVESATFGNVGGDFSAQGVNALRCRPVGGDAALPNLSLIH